MSNTRNMRGNEAIKARKTHATAIKRSKFLNMVFQFSWLVNLWLMIGLKQRIVQTAMNVSFYKKTSVVCSWQISDSMNFIR